MKITNLIRGVAQIVLAALLGSASFAQTEPSARKIPFRSGVRLVDALKPGDRVVTLDAPGRIDFAETFPGTVDDELYELSRMPEVAIFTVQDSKSFLSQDGAWVRTRVTAVVDHALRHAAKIPWGDQPDGLVLEFENGEIELNGVTVKAGRYPTFITGARYLGILAYDSLGKGWKLNRGFRIGLDGKLIRLNNWDGSAAWRSGALEGLPIETVIQHLNRK